MQPMQPPVTGRKCGVGKDRMGEGKLPIGRAMCRQVVEAELSVLQGCLPAPEAGMNLPEQHPGSRPMEFGADLPPVECRNVGGVEHCLILDCRS